MSNEGNGVDEQGLVETQVMILADTPASENEEVVSATAVLIEAAKNAKLVSVICTHIESRQPATILCAMILDEDNQEIAQYVPLAMLFTGDNAPWVAYQPPLAASIVQEEIDPLIVFSESESEVEDNESESQEAS